MAIPRLASVAAVVLAAAAVAAGSAAGADAPAGVSYRNPVLSGFHPDPSVVRVGDCV